VKATRARPKIEVTADGKGIVSHAGLRLPAEVADDLGLTQALSAAMAPTQKRRRPHDPGKVLLDVALSLIDGGDCLSDLAAVRNEADLFGPVASTPTAWRVIDSVDNQRRAAISAARAWARRRAWEAGARPGWIVMDLDATLVVSHSEKHRAAPTYKRSFGHHPMFVYLDGTEEALAAMLRAGNAGSNTASDQITVVDDALAQLPVATRAADPEHGEWMLLRADSASCTHEFASALRARAVEFSIGFPLTEEVTRTLGGIEESVWQPCITQDCEEREGAECTEITAALDLSSWPEGTRVIARREDPHPGAQFSFTDLDGHRFQCFMCDSTDEDIAFLEARHRGHARVEDRIRGAKDIGLANLPFHDFTANAAWVELVLMAQDLVAWTKALCLRGELASAEPKRLRFALWHTAGRLVRTGRRLILRLAVGWPWVRELQAGFGRLRALDLTA
jgi:hypothetical protein